MIFILFLVACLSVFCNQFVYGAGAAGNISITDKFAWSENTGWLAFRSADAGVMVYDDHLEGYAWGENIGWIKLGSHTGGGRFTYLNSTTDNWGVNRNGATLSGFAWSENAGWIKLNPGGGGISVNPATGEFSGYAWGENIGWISLRNQVGAPLVYGVGLMIDTLTLSFAGGGAGSVVSQSPPFSCNTNCTQNIPDMTSLTLTANPADYSLFATWSGCDGALGTVCNLTLDSDRNVEIIFTRDAAYTARIHGATPLYYRTLQEAYDKAMTGNVIEVWGIDLAENLACGTDKVITIRGGYDRQYLARSGVTSLHGLNISRGMVTVDGIVVK